MEVCLLSFRLPDKIMIGIFNLKEVINYFFRIGNNFEQNSEQYVLYSLFLVKLLVGFFDQNQITS